MGQNITIAATPPAALIVSGNTQDPQAGVIFNQSTNNTLYIGNDPSVSPTDPLNNTPVAPLTYVPFDGTEDIYAIAAAGQTVPLAIMLGVSGAPFSGKVQITGPTTVIISGTVAVNVTNTPSVNIANTPNVNIANTPSVTISGTPTVDIGTVSGSINIASVSGNVDVVGQGGYLMSGQFTSIINDTAGHAINAASNYTTPAEDMRTYTSFALGIQAYNTGMGTVGSPLVVPVVISHYADAAATLLVYRETYWAWLANSAVNAATIPLKVSGPIHGGYMTVEFINFTNTGTINIPSIQLYGTGRTIAKPNGHQASPLNAGISSNGISLLAAVNWTSFGGFSAMIQGDDNICALEVNDATFPLSSSEWMPFPLHCGKVSANYSVGSALAHAFVLCSAAGLVSGGVVAGTNSQGLLWSVGTATLSARTDDLAVGNAPTYAVLSSTATQPAPTLSITGGMD